VAKNVARRAEVLASLARRIDRIKRKDARIVEATQLAPFVDANGDVALEVEEALGRPLTNLEKRVALDAQLSKRDAPVYLELAAKRYEVERKVEALRGAPTMLNAQPVIAFVLGSAEATARYPVIDVEAKDVSSRELPPLPEPVKKEEP
jgi:hypothetical protein